MKIMDPRIALDHQFVTAAYTITWVVQLGYLAWTGIQWRAARREAERLRKDAR